jgi:hypothetical protein
MTNNLNDPFTGVPLGPRFNLPDSFGKAASYWTQIRKLLELLQDNYWDWATKTELSNTVAAINRAIEAGDQRVYDNLANQISQLSKLVELLTIQANVYDPTQGKYTDSRTAHNNMMRELSVFGARVNQMATKTCKQAAQYACITWSSTGNRDIFGNSAPRNTPIRNNN